MSDIIKNAFTNIDPNNEQFVNKNLDIIEEVHALMKSKGVSQVALAKLLDKKPSEISKWLSGMHNLTLRSITKMEVALDQDIIMTCKEAKEKYEKVNYVHVNIDAKRNERKEYNAVDFSADYAPLALKKLA